MAVCDASLYAGTMETWRDEADKKKIFAKNAAGLLGLP